MDPKWPFGPADNIVATAGATLSVSVSNTNTLLSFDADLAANMALTIVPHEDLKEGALLTIRAKSDGTARSITFAAGAEGPGLPGTISKTKTCLLRYDGTKFVQVSAAVQLD